MVQMTTGKEGAVLGVDQGGSARSIALLQHEGGVEAPQLDRPLNSEASAQAAGVLNHVSAGTGGQPSSTISSSTVSTGGHRMGPTASAGSRAGRRAPEEKGCCSRLVSWFCDLIVRTYDRFGIYEDETGFMTHYACHCVRLIFLLSHGLLVIVVSAQLDNSEASWFWLFTPIWVGDVLCCLLAVFAWIASCPYITFAMSSMPANVKGPPKLLTELFPEIFLAVLGFIFLVLIFIGEYSFCSYLAAGDGTGLTSAAVPLCVAAALAVCHGALLTTDSPLYICVGLGVLLSVVIFGATRESAAREQALAVVPSAVAVLVLLLCMLNRLCRFYFLLSVEELALRALEAIILALMFMASVAATFKMWHDKLAEASSDGVILGLCLCLIALLRARLCWWEAKGGTLEERSILQVAEPRARGRMSSTSSSFRFPPPAEVPSSVEVQLPEVQLPEPQATSATETQAAPPGPGSPKDKPLAQV